MTDETSTLGERWTSRKFWAMVVWEAVMVVLFWVGKLPEASFVSVTYLLLGGYFVSNVAQKALAPKVGGTTSGT